MQNFRALIQCLSRQLGGRRLLLSVCSVAIFFLKESSVRLWRERFEADPKWYPGKDEDEDVFKGGRPKVITGQQEHAIATSAMAMKERGLVPSVSAILASCPQATLNPETDEPFSAKVILRVFKTKCYDQDPEHPWK